MKAQMDANGSGGGSVGGVRDGKVHKNRHHHQNHHQGHRTQEENAEIKAYLTKLQQLVPFMPKNRKLSKLEVITHVIDYIRDLRQTLGLPPCIGNNDFDMESASAIMMTAQPPSQVNSPHPSAITLNVINNDSASSSPSTPVPNTSSPSPHHQHHHYLHQHHQPHPRQPLCVITNPNGNTNPSGSHEIPQLMDKSPSTDDVDTRPVSC